MKTSNILSAVLRSGLIAQFRQTAFFGLGAVAGVAVSATASYAIVSALYPRQAEPVQLAVVQAPAAAPGSAAQTSVLASAPADHAIAITPLAPLDPPAEDSALHAERVRAEATDPARTPPPSTGIVATATTFDEATLDRSALSDAMIAASGRREETPLPPRAESAPAGPERFAALSAGDADARGGATLGFVQPAPKPEQAAAVMPAADPDMPRIRPAPRPDVMPVLASMAVAASPADAAIPAIRPAPRPEVVRVAAAEPAPARAAVARGSAACGPKLANAIPRRAGNAPGGVAFFAGLGGLSGPERDRRVIDELARGNMPDYLRNLQPVTFRGPDARGIDSEIVICVTPDYLALGSDRDHVRVPLGLPAAARIAGRFDMTLPTPRMVDAIYAQADVKLKPAPMQPGPQMSSTDYFLRHNSTIDSQLGGRGGLVAGQKKDVVLANRLASSPGRVAIYGWHRSGGDPIQPVSTVHGATYADYSHGIRLVSKTAFLNGRAVSLDELLGSGRYAYLLNKDGPLPGPVIRTASR